MGERLPLAGYRVVEVASGLPSALCTRLLAGFGAEVIRFEPPDEPEVLTDDQMVAFVAGKRRVTGPYSVLSGLVAEADVVVEGRPPGWMADHGLDPDRLRAARPSLVLTSISPFGQTGPRRDWATTNAVQFAVGGLMSLTGHPSRSPLVTGGEQAMCLGGLHGAAATAGVVLGSARHGRGDHIDVSLQECAASMPELYGAMTEYELGGEPVARAGNSVRAAWGVYRAADGWAGVCCLERQIPALFRLIGDHVSGDERFTDPTQRPEHDDELLAYVMAFMAEHTQQQLLDLSPVHRVPFGAVLTPADLLADRGLWERGFFTQVAVEDESIGAGVQAVDVPGRPFPGLGWVDGAVLSKVEPSEGPCVFSGGGAGVRSGEAVRRRPLEGIRVADLTMMWAGPYATKLMAELGAEVIKIESPSAWDNIRTLVPQDPAITDPWNSAYYFNEYNHSKKSVTLDLAQEAGRQAFLELVATCDVVIENYRADVLDGLGLGYDVLRSARNDIVLVTMAGFGKTGPLSRHVGFGPIIEMMSGLMSLTGYGDGEPMKTGISYGDPVGGLAAVLATGLALLERDRGGGGTHVDLAQRESAAWLASPAFVAQSARGEDPPHSGNRDPRFVPQGCYPAQGTDQWVVISVRSDEEWNRLAEVIDRPDWIGLGEAERSERHDELDAAIQGWTSTRDQQTAAELLQGRGVPAGAVLDTAAIREDPQLVDRGFYVEVENPKMHRYRQTGPTWRLVDSPPHHMVRSPWFGEHNDEILGAALGFDADRLDALARSLVTGTAPVNPTSG